METWFEVDASSIILPLVKIVSVGASGLLGGGPLLVAATTGLVMGLVVIVIVAVAKQATLGNVRFGSASRTTMGGVATTATGAATTGSGPTATGAATGGSGEGPSGAEQRGSISANAKLGFEFTLERSLGRNCYEQK